jgi:hypothetical protein
MIRHNTPRKTPSVRTPVIDNASPETALRLVVVINRPDVVTATVRAMQYKPWFDGDSEFDARFVFRIPVWFVKLRQAWPQRRWLRWIIDSAEKVVLGSSDLRIRQLSKTSDVVYAITTPSARLQESLRQSGAMVIMDVIDALWLPWFRQGGWHDLEQLLATADGIICENGYTADYVRQYSDVVHIVSDSPQLEKFDELRNEVVRSDEGPVVLGWIGGKDSVDALYAIYEPLERLFATHGSKNLQLRILGAPADRLPRFEHVRFSVRPAYDQEEMVRESLGMHIGLFPQFEVEESLNRGSLKAKIYMSGGAVAVCQDLGENRTLIRDGHNGLLAANSRQWLEKLDWLVTHPDERKRLAAAGLQTIRELFTTEICYRRLAGALRDIYRQRRSHGPPAWKCRS